ncbi:MAG TPA: DNA-binding transcriptional regulator [Methylomirabilota bacterium]|nr:DNA-binding transcriptional regulator [Methylomirabilota bacterium]
MSSPSRIVLALPLGVPHLEEVVHGIRRYAQRHAQWDFITSPETHSVPVASLAGWEGEGVIGMVNTPADLRVIKTLQCPVVNLSGALENPGLPRVRVDYEAAGVLAAQHLLSRGFERFAFYGLKGIFYAEALLRGFRHHVEKHGGQCSVYEDQSTIGLAKPWQHDHESLDRWLQSLQTPVGLMASHDPRAVMVVQSCRRIGWRVPDDVAVIGLNNDVFSCEFCEPPLTSISRHGERIGFEAAALLDRLLHGEPPPPADIVIPPGDVIERRSTDTLAVGDVHELARAIQFIHSHLHQPITVEQILASIGMSRRWLETAFRRKLHTTPHAYISRLRVKKTTALMRENPKLRLKEVALSCGFTSTRQMNFVFRSVTGVSPRQYLADVRDCPPRGGGAAPSPSQPAPESPARRG